MKVKLIFLAAVLMLVFGFSAGEEEQELASYSISDPMKVDTAPFHVKKGKTYFRFDTRHGPSGKKAEYFFAAYLINTSDTVFGLEKQDGSLIMIQEAMDEKGAWQPIEYRIPSYCGNSYYDYKLYPGEYAQIKVRKYSGKFKTKIRMKLSTSNGMFYSAPFSGSVDKLKFKRKTGTVKGHLFEGPPDYLEPWTFKIPTR